MEIFDKSWLKRRWFEFRIGHGTYISFALSLINFVLISYNFLFSQIAALDLWLFTLILIVVYVPLNTLVGRWHNATVLSTDSDIQAKANPYCTETLELLYRIEERQKVIEAQLKELHGAEKPAVSDRKANR